MSRLIAPTTLRFGDVAKPGIEPQPAGVGHRHGMPADPTGGLTLAAGTYTPTLTAVANLDAVTAFNCQYLRVGNTVTVSGRCTVDPTAAATSTSLGISLPVASNFGALEDCGGVAFSTAGSTAGDGGGVSADVANDRARVDWLSSDLANHGLHFIFQYQVI